MAFNPFELFRRNIKVFMVALAVLCMFTFVLSAGIGGGGDFTDTLKRWLDGDGSGSGDYAFTVYGSSYSTGQLARVQTRRAVANEYMFLASLIAYDGLLTEAAQTTREDQGVPDDLKTGLLQLRFLLSNFQDLENLGRIRSLPRVQRRAFIDGIAATLNQIELTRSAELKKSQSAREALRRAKIVLRFMEAQFGPDGLGPTVFFTNMPYAGEAPERRESADFLIMLAKADEMGVTLKADQANAIFRRLTAGVFQANPEAVKRFEQMQADLLSRKRGITEEEILSALNDEFRVMIAQNALLGRADTLTPRSAPAAYVTPRFAWEFYKENIAPATFALIEIDVGEFIGRVEKEPKMTELKALHRKYASTPPDEDSPTPGFERPRHLGLGWMKLTIDTPHYRERLPVSQVAASLICPLNSPLAAGVMAAVPAADRAAFAETQYKNYLNAQPGYDDPTRLGARLNAENTLRPTSLAAMAAQAGGSLAGCGPAGLNGLAARQMLSVRRELVNRVRVGVPRILAGAGPFGPLAAAAGPSPSEPDPVPESAATAGADEAYFRARAGTLYLQESNQFIAELAKKKTPRESRAFIRRWSEARGFEVGRSAAPVAVDDLAEAEGLEPLKSVQSFGQPLMPQYVSGLDERAKLFNANWYNIGIVMGPDNRPQLGLAAPMAVREDQYFLVWPYKDERAKPFDFREIEGRVRKEWKRLRAQEMVAEYAKDLAEKLKKDRKTTEAQLTDFASAQKKGLTVRKLPFVSRLSSSPSPRPQPGQPLPKYQFIYRLTEPRSAAVPKPGEGFLDGLMALRGAKSGEKTAVLHDMAKSRYYVATLLEEPEPQFDDFKSFYSRLAAGAFGQKNSNLMDDFLLPGAFEQRRKLLLAQIKAEGEYEENKEAFKAAES